MEHIFVLKEQKVNLCNMKCRALCRKVTLWVLLYVCC